MNDKKQLQVNQIYANLQQNETAAKKRETSANWQLASETKEVPKRWASTEFDDL